MRLASKQRFVRQILVGVSSFTRSIMNINLREWIFFQIHFQNLAFLHPYFASFRIAIFEKKCFKIDTIITFFYQI